MSVREIEVHIEELVLHGFAPGARWSVADALEARLHGLLAERGLPASWLANPERLSAGPMSASGLTRSATAGRGIAEAIYEGKEAAR